LPCLVSSASFFPSLPLLFLPPIYIFGTGRTTDRTRARPRLPGSVFHLRPVRRARTPQQVPRSSSASLHSMSWYSKTLFSIYTPSVLNYRKPLFIPLAPSKLQIPLAFFEKGKKTLRMAVSNRRPAAEPKPKIGLQHNIYSLQ
jgi:hypothetical protein